MKITYQGIDYENLFKASLTYSDNLFLVLSEDFVIQEISPTVEKILGWGKEVYPQQVNTLFEKYQTEPFIDTNQPISRATRTTYVLNDNRKLKIIWEVIPFYNQEKSCHLIFIIGKNATELTDEQFEYLQLESVVKYAPGFFYWKDINSVYQGCNEEFARLAGLNSRREVKGKTDFELIWKNRASLYVEVDQEVMRTGKAKLNHEEAITVSNNMTVIAITNKVPLLDNRNRVIGILGISTDITAQKNTEEALLRAKVAAESANILKTNFIQNMQHDIRTPASSVWAVLDDLVKKHQMPDEELLVMLRNSSKQLWDICNDVIDFDRIEHGDTPVLFKRLDIRQIVKNVVELNEISAFDRKLALSCVVDENIPHVVKGDEHRLSRILINLMGNALKFTSQGFVSLSAKLIKERQKDYIIQFKLQDTGIGIPVEKQSTLYEKFNRLNPANRNLYKGSGLGLRIVKKYVDDIGGEINVKSELNKGTTFFIDLPFEKALIDTVYDDNRIFPDKSIEVKTEGSPLTNLIQQGSHSVLLIEDNDLARRSAKNQLESIHCRVTTAVNVITALEALELIKFDLVVSDIGLPDGTGIDVIKRIKNDKRALNYLTPFVALTANVDKETIRQCESSGFSEVLTKPWEIKRMQQLIVNFISNKETKHEQATSPTDAIEFKQIPKQLLAEEEELFFLEQYPLFDMGVAKRIFGASYDSIVPDLLKSMAESIPNDREKIAQAFKARDWQRVQELAHKTKGGAAFCGNIRMRYACQYLERYCKPGHSKLLEKLYDQLMHVMDETKAYIINVGLQ